MASRFDQALDDCLTRIILQGEPVEACLARYPDLAAELEPHIQVALRTARAFAFTPSAASRERGRQRLLTEMRELERAEAQRGGGGPSWRGLRWALASAAAVLVVLAGGFGVARASASALPGQPLYTVKRTVEQTRLALAFSDEEKAELHLAYAQRRARELGLLVSAGREDRLKAVGDDLRQSLDAAADIARALDNESAVAGLQVRLEESASESLTNLQVALQAAPESAREAASEVFVKSSEAFGSTIETVAAEAPPAYASAAPGVLQLWASDPPPPDLEQVLVQVDQIEAHLVTPARGGQWVTLTQEPQTFDLLRIAEVRRFLGEQQVQPGTYTKVRFRINSVTVVANGQAHQAIVPSGHLDLVRPFRVEEGQTTVVLLDFEGAESIKMAGRDDYILAPRVRVLAQEPETLPPDRPSRGGRPRERDGRPGRGAGAVPPLTGEEGIIAEVEGAIEEVAQDFVVVRGKRIAVNAQTRVDSALEVGGRVRVEAQGQPGGGFLALSIAPSMPPREPGDSGRPRETVVQVQGVIESMSEGEWVVAGQRIAVPPDTAITGDARPGASATVDGVAQAGGVVLAQRIVVTPVGGQAGETPTPTPSPQRTVNVSGLLELLDGLRWTIDGRRVIITLDTKIEGVLAPGTRVQIEGTVQPDGSIQAVTIRLLGPPPRPSPTQGPEGKGPGNENKGPEEKLRDQVRLRGTLQALEGDRWLVDGEAVAIDQTTLVDGLPAVGATVQIEGFRQEDGTILATVVRLFPPRGNGPREEATPTPTPTPAPGPAPADTPTPTPAPVSFQGTLEQALGDEWTVGGRRVVLDASALVSGVPEPGSVVSIEGVLREDGVTVALVATVLQVPTLTPTPTPEPTPTVAPIPGPAPTATPSLVPTDTPTPEALDFTGTVASLDVGEWCVDGRKVRLSATTALDGVAAPGVRVRVRGALASDGAILADSIEVLGPSLPPALSCLLPGP